jgi:hypothetical protein
MTPVGRESRSSIRTGRGEDARAEKQEGLTTYRGGKSGVVREDVFSGVP